MSPDSGVLLALSEAQVAQVVRDAAGGGGGVAGLLGGLGDPARLGSVARGLLANQRYSRSVLIAFLVLGAFPQDGTPREVTVVARELGLAVSTTHRYVRTLLALGLLEQAARSRRYRRPAPALGGRGG
jgi:IclR helix-turn-helix domain